VTELAAYGDDPSEEAAEASKDNGKDNNANVAKAHARQVLDKNEVGDTISQVATKLFLLADADGDGRISLLELAAMFETVHKAANGDNSDDNNNPQVFPQPLRALAGSLQLLPPTEGTSVLEASSL
jgi:ribonuclease Z